MPLWQPNMTEQRMKMIEQALKDKAPKIWKDLKRSGEKEEYIRLTEEAMMEEFDLDYDKILEEQRKAIPAIKIQMVANILKIKRRYFYVIASYSNSKVLSC